MSLFSFTDDSQDDWPLLPIIWQSLSAVATKPVQACHWVWVSLDQTKVYIYTVVKNCTDKEEPYMLSGLYRPILKPCEYMSPTFTSYQSILNDTSDLGLREIEILLLEEMYGGFKFFYMKQ